MHTLARHGVRVGGWHHAQEGWIHMGILYLDTGLQTRRSCSPEQCVVLPPMAAAAAADRRATADTAARRSSVWGGHANMHRWLLEWHAGAGPSPATDWCIDTAARIAGCSSRCPRLVLHAAIQLCDTQPLLCPQLVNKS